MTTTHTFPPFHGEWLPVARHRKGLGARALAALLPGASEEEIAGIEGGLRPFTGDRALQVCKALDIPIAFFLDIFDILPSLSPFFDDKGAPLNPRPSGLLLELHRLLDHGHLGARTAAGMLGLTLQELVTAFEREGLTDPFSY